MQRPLPKGRRCFIGLGGSTVGALFGLSACGQVSGIDLAQQACVHVQRSVHDYELSAEPLTSAALVARLRAEASDQLRAALPLAAAATSDDGSLNALMTTISESATVDEGHLIPALKGQSAMVRTNVNVNPAPAGNVPNSNVNPKPGGQLPGS